MSRKCLGGCGKYIGDDRVYCISCEKTLFGNGGLNNGEETQEEEGEEETEAGESSRGVS